MVSVPLGQSDYARDGSKSPRINVFNRFFEKNPTNQVESVAMLLRPAIVEAFTSIGAGPIRRIFFPEGGFLGDFFVVSGSALYRVHRTASAIFTPTLITGTLGTANRPSLAATKDKLFITDQVGFYYTDGTAALSEIATDDDIPFAKIDSIAGYILGAQVGTQRFYWVPPAEITVDPLDFAEAEGYSDKLTDLISIGDKFYLCGYRSIEAWLLTGLADAPFQRMQGQFFNYGVVPDTACRLDGTQYVAVTCPDGTVRIIGIDDKISNSAVEERIRRAIKSKIATEF